MPENSVPAVSGRNGGTLTPWPKGVSGNPKGKPPRAITTLLKRLDDKAEADKLVDDYLALCHSKDQNVRLAALKDLLDRVGFKAVEEKGNPATATVVNIIRNTPNLNMRRNDDRG